MVISDRSSKLYRTVPIKYTEAQAVDQVFVTHWGWTYGTPIWPLSDNGIQLTSNLFQDTWWALGVWNMFSITGQPHANVQVDGPTVQCYNNLSIM